MPDATVAFIMKTIKQRELALNHLSQSTVYRFFHQQDLMKQSKALEDCRKFEAEHTNEMWPK